MIIPMRVVMEACLAGAVLRWSRIGTLQQQVRSFAIGAHQASSMKVHKAWHEVKTMDRLGELREVQRERGRGSDGVAPFAQELAPRIPAF